MNKKIINTNLRSEIRRHYFLEKYVIITPGRALRPRQIKHLSPAITKHNNNCPFCPENLDKNNIIDRIGPENNWQVLSIGNIFPAVSVNNKKAYGVQEVIIENPDHDKELKDLSEVGIERVLRMYARRTAALSRNKKIEYILCLKNQGAKSGASIAHGHSQVFATNFLPPEVAVELQMSRAYHKKNKTCVYCDIIKKEAKSSRKIFTDNNIIAFTPHASEFQYEAWIFTKRHLDNITNLNDQEFKSFAHTLKIILTKISRLGLSFNYFMHQVVSDCGQHFYLKIQPRATIWAGIELSSGLIINEVAPETAAAYYRRNN